MQKKIEHENHGFYGVALASRRAPNQGVLPATPFRPMASPHARRHHLGVGRTPHTSARRCVREKKRRRPLPQDLESGSPPPPSSCSSSPAATPRRLKPPPADRSCFLCSTSSRGSAPMLPLLPPPADLHFQESPLQLCPPRIRGCYSRLAAACPPHPRFSPLPDLCMCVLPSPSSVLPPILPYSFLCCSSFPPPLPLLCFFVLMLCSSLLFVVLSRNR